MKRWERDEEEVSKRGRGRKRGGEVEEKEGRRGRRREGDRERICVDYFCLYFTDNGWLAEK